MDDALNIHASTSRFVPSIGHAGWNQDFQRLLLLIQTQASEGVSDSALLESVCRSAREFLRVSGVYFWKKPSENELFGEQANGRLADHFQGMRLRLDGNSVTAEAVRRRRTIFLNRVRESAFPEAAELGACSVMAVPLVVLNEVMGAFTLIHDSDENFFNEESAAKVTTLAEKLGNVIAAQRPDESFRAAENSPVEKRNGHTVEDSSQAQPSAPDVTVVIEGLADRVRVLLRTRLVCVLLRRDVAFELLAVSAETAQLANTVRARHDRQTIRFAADLAQRAVSAGEPITLALGAEAHSLGNLVSPGMLVAVPFRTTRTQGAILVYPRQEGAFSDEEKSLVAALAGFGAVAVAHAEQYAAAANQARELRELLDITSELVASRDLDHFLQAFVARAADFLGFGRCFIGLHEDGVFHVRWGIERGATRRVDEIFPEGVVSRTLLAKEYFSTDDASKTPGVNLEVVAKYRVQQFLAVPLLNAEGKLLGMCGLLDRFDSKSISPEDIRRARTLASHAAGMLEVAQNLHLSPNQRRRADAMMELATENNGFEPVPEFARRFILRACELGGFRAGALALFQDGHLQIAALHPALHEKEGSSDPTKVAGVDAAQPGNAEGPPEAQELERTVAHALTAFTVQHSEILISGYASDLLGADVARALGWDNCTIVRLPGSGKEPLGLLCLSGGAPPNEPEDRALLEALASHAANSIATLRRFSRMEQTNRHWMEIFDATTDFIVVHDQSDKVLRVNHSLAAMIGVAPSELVGVNMRALLVVSSDVSSYSCPFCRSMSNGTDEFVHPIVDRTYVVSTSRIQGAAEEGMHTIHVLKDISDRREAERRYREMFENIQEGLFFSTPAGRFIEVNEALVQMLGYASREELLQIDIPTQLHFSAGDVLHLQPMDESGHLHNYEATLRRKNGSPIHVLINAFGLHDNLGRLIQMRGLMLDVTGLRTYQSELHRERDFSGQILNNTPSLILVSDTAGLISYANRRWADSGFHQRDLLGRPLLELAAPGFVRPFAEAIQNALNGQQVSSLELQVLRGTGVIGKFSANLNPMHDEQGTVTSMVVILTDITDSLMLRDQLIHAEKMAAVGQLVSGVAHEVNNPLTAILGFADLLMENTELPENARKDLRVILQEAQRTKTIVQNLLSFARQMPPQRNALQLNVILERTIQLRSYDFNNHGIDVVEHLDERLPQVIGDAQQLQQVFLNILNNAYDAVHDIGRPARIEIVTAKSGSVVEVSFRDNGQGISHPDRIFDPFFTTKEIGKGTGLGLSICYGIVKEHGGEITCHNNSDGQGATFVIRLPVAAHSASLGMAAGDLQL